MTMRDSYITRTNKIPIPNYELGIFWVLKQNYVQNSSLQVTSLPKNVFDSFNLTFLSDRFVGQSVKSHAKEREKI